MKKVLLVALTLVISLAFATGVFSQAREETPPQSGPTGPAPEKMAPKAKTMRYTGEVTKVDAMGKMIMVKGKKGEMSFDVSMAKWKPYKSMDEVKQGDPVTVRYMEKGGKMMASSVTKGKPSGVKEESTAESEGKKADKGSAPKAPMGGSIPQESSPATK